MDSSFRWNDNYSGFPIGVGNDKTKVNHRFRLGRKAVPPGGQIGIKEIGYGPAAVPQAKQG